MEILPFAGGSLGKSPSASEPHRGSRTAKKGRVSPEFGCQQQPPQGHAAPQVRHSSKAPTASVTSAYGEWDPSWGCKWSAEPHAPNVRKQNGEEFRCCSPVGTGPLILVLCVSTPVSKAYFEAQINQFTRTDTAVAAGEVQPRGCQNLAGFFR